MGQYWLEKLHAKHGWPDHRHLVEVRYVSVGTELWGHCTKRERLLRFELRSNQKIKRAPPSTT
jgi:hypothetical protein